MEFPRLALVSEVQRRWSAFWRSTDCKLPIPSLWLEFVWLTLVPGQFTLQLRCWSKPEGEERVDLLILEAWRYRIGQFYHMRLYPEEEKDDVPVLGRWYTCRNPEIATKILAPDWLPSEYWLWTTFWMAYFCWSNSTDPIDYYMI